MEEISDFEKQIRFMDKLYSHDAKRRVVNSLYGSLKLCVILRCARLILFIIHIPNESLFVRSTSNTLTTNTIATPLRKMTIVDWPYLDKKKSKAFAHET